MLRRVQLVIQKCHDGILEKKKNVAVPAFLNKIIIIILLYKSTWKTIFMLASGTHKQRKSQSEYKSTDFRLFNDNISTAVFCFK
jgi:hypothetical protein